MCSSVDEQGRSRTNRAKWRTWASEDLNFKRWIDRLSRQSAVTGQEYPRVLQRFLDKHNLTPAGLVQKAKRARRQVEDTLDDFISTLEREGKAPSYIGNYTKTIKSWLKFNEIVLVREFRVANRGLTPSLKDERIPTKDELKAILNAASPRGRAIISMVAFSGVRPGVLGNFHGTDGLRLKDLPELVLEKKQVTFTKIPALIVVRPELSKIRRKYLTFLASEGCDYLKMYLDLRLAAGEILDSDAAVIAVAPSALGRGPRKGREDGHGTIATKNVTSDIRDAMRRAGHTWRPYVLRSYFATSLLVAEGHVGLPLHYRVFWMGHKSGIGMEWAYTVGKNHLPAEFIEEMRTKFAAAEQYLTTTGRPPVAAIDREALDALATVQEAFEADPANLARFFGEFLKCMNVGVTDAAAAIAQLEKEAQP